jgi:hypothetical protein
MILKCVCSHEYQDKKHGSGNRVHNPLKDDKGGQMWRCTICKTERLGAQGGGNKGS